MELTGYRETLLALFHLREICSKFNKTEKQDCDCKGLEAGKMGVEFVVSRR